MLRDSNHCNTFQPGLLTRKHSAWEQRKLNEYLETSREKNESCRFDKDDVLSVSGD